MILAVVGSRNFTDFDLLNKKMKTICENLEITKVVSGGAAGADSMAAMFAQDNNIPCEVIRPDWSIGKHAGMLRNTKIIEKADIVMAFWDRKSPGTKDSIEKARMAKKPIYIIYFD